MLTLTLNRPTNLPLELSGILPETFAEKSDKDRGRFTIWHGNQELHLSDLFTVKGSCADGQIAFVGDLHSAVGIGARMKSGSIRVDGDAGHDVGLGMQGGELEVKGNVHANLGAQMHGGVIRVRGTTAANVGGALPGAARGMAGGAILIDGDVGDFVGRRMRRGLIAIRGKTGDFLGHGMLAGSIVADKCGVHPGAEMSRGTICIVDSDAAGPWPTFRHACTAHSPVLGMIGRQLQSYGYENDLWNANRRWIQFNGDLLISGRGEIFIGAC